MAHSLENGMLRSMCAQVWKFWSLRQFGASLVLGNGDVLAKFYRSFVDG